MLAAFVDIESASQAVSAIISAGIIPAALEMMDALTIQAVEPASTPDTPWMPARCCSSKSTVDPKTSPKSARDRKDLLRQAAAMQVRAAASKAERDLLWKGRKMAIAAMGRLAPNYYLHDTVVPRTRLPQTMKRVAKSPKISDLPIANCFMLVMATCTH